MIQDYSFGVDHTTHELPYWPDSETLSERRISRKMYSKRKGNDLLLPPFRWRRLGSTSELSGNRIGLYSRNDGVFVAEVASDET